MTIDAKMMFLADKKAHVTGLYYGKRFSGVAVSSRQNTVNWREMLTIELDGPILKPGDYWDGDPIILTAGMVESGNHRIDQLSEVE